MNRVNVDYYKVNPSFAIFPLLQALQRYWPKLPGFLLLVFQFACIRMMMRQNLT